MNVVSVDVCGIVVWGLSSAMHNGTCMHYIL